jgi:hypothetical protein
MMSGGASVGHGRPHAPSRSAAHGGVETQAGADQVLYRTRALLGAFAVLTALATTQLLVFGGRTDRYWAWTIPQRQTAAFLGAAYAAGFLLSALSLRQHSWRQVRVTVATVAVFASLTLGATLWHAHRLHLLAEDLVARSAAWFWTGVYLAVPLLCLAVIVRQGARRGPDAISDPIPAWLRKLLAVQAAVLLAVGAVLFTGGLMVHHGTVPTAVFWPWPLPPLAAQVLGAWLAALGVGATLGILDGDLGRLRVQAIAYTAFGTFELVVLMWFRSQSPGADASLWSCGALLATMTLTGGYGWWLSRRERVAT